MTDQRGLGGTFDSVADLYHQVRPEYPEPLHEAMITAAGLHTDARLIEVGCATGKATLPLARRGFRITCVEHGSELATVARRNLADFPEVEVLESNFEGIDPPGHDPFDQREGIEASGLFEPILVRQFDWRSATTLTATCGCSTRSRATSRCNRGSATACTQRSGADWNGE